MAETPQVQIERAAPRKPGRSLLVTGIALAILLAGGLGWNYYYGPCGVFRVRSTTEEFSTLIDEWKDALDLAGATPRMTLSGPLAEMQSVRRNAENLEVPACMRHIHTNLISGMDNALEGFYAFGQQKPDTVVEGYFRSANGILQNVADGLIAVSNCAPSCPVIER